MIRENPASRDTETLRLLSARALGARKSALVTCPFSFIGPATLAGSMRWSGVEGGAGAEWSGAGAEWSQSGADEADGAKRMVHLKRSQAERGEWSRAKRSCA